MAGHTYTSVGYGLKNVNDQGYAFSSSLMRSEYQIASIAVGAALGLVVAIIILAFTGNISIRRR
jgi:uncharacterized membrane protein YciS (DUF1049 family)